MSSLPSVYQEVIAMSRYARYMPEKKRRENWEETVTRLTEYLKTKVELDTTEWADLHNSVLNLEVMPSMRLLMTAGEACERDNIAAYNCSYLAVNNKRAFSEALYILMNGTGVGFSCERQEIDKLPEVPSELKYVDDVIFVEDSKLGWAKAFKKLLSSLWEGDIPTFDFSKVRPAGARLKVFGGRASGPEPLKKLFDFVVESFKKAKGRKLNSIEVHDIMCMIGEIVVVGGVRRSALISLSNLTDKRMRDAKTGAWYNDNSHRGLANNSVAYTEKPDSETFMEEWLSLVKSKSGERGIFNRVAAQNQANKWGRRDPTLSYGTNPCSEIILEYAKKFDIAPSASITCVKPSGTVSQLVDSASGIHARHNDFYTRRIRMDKKDPIYDYLKAMGVTVEDEVFRPDSTAVFSFPMKAPKGAILRNDKTAIEQLEIWLVYQRHWCEHKPSVTISVKDEEWPEVGAWVWKHFDEISGVSFLPHSNHTYQQAPYEDCTEEQYKELLAKTPSRIDWADFLEVEDNTTGQQTLACTAGSCEI